MLIAENDIETRIAGTAQQIEKMKAKYGQSPFTVAVSAFTGGYCGGILIEWNYVLTAAHCLDGDGQTIPKHTEVKAGIIKLSDDPNEQKQIVKPDEKHVIFHENYKRYPKDLGSFDLGTSN